MEGCASASASASAYASASASANNDEHTSPIGEWFPLFCLLRVFHMFPNTNVCMFVCF